MVKSWLSTDDLIYVFNWCKAENCVWRILCSRHKSRKLHHTKTSSRRRHLQLSSVLMQYQLLFQECWSTRFWSISSYADGVLPFRRVPNHRIPKCSCFVAKNPHSLSPITFKPKLFQISNFLAFPGLTVCRIRSYELTIERD